MLNVKSKNGMASLRYTMLAVGSIIIGMIGITQAYDYRYPLNNGQNLQIIDNDRTINLIGAPGYWSLYSRNIESNGNITTTYDGTTNLGVFLPINDAYNQLRNTESVFWNNNELYYYSKDYFQGYFAFFCTGTINSTSFKNCLATQHGGIIDYSNYQTYIDSGTLVPIEEFNNNSQYHNNIIGFFYTDSNGAGNYSASEPPFGFIYSDDTFVAFPIIQKASINSSEPNNGYNLTGTLGISFTQPMSYANFQAMNSLKEEAPTVGGNSNNTTNTPCITIEQLLKMGGRDYNTGMCYTDSKYWSGNTTTGEYINITPKSIFELYPTYTELREDMNIYNNYCNNYVATQQACMTAFSGSKGLNITLLDKLKGKDSTRLNTLYDYCKTREVYSGSLDTNTCDLTDEDIKNIVPSMLTPEGQAENIMQQGITTTQPGEGTVYDGLVDETNRDIITAIPRVIEKIETMFFNNSGVEGIIPDYITRIILLTVLFLIFKH